MDRKNRPQNQRKQQQGSYWDPASQPVNIYTDSARAAVNFYSVMLELGESANAGEPKGQLHARVKMSPAHGKALLILLGGIVAQYEEQFGEIALPPDLQGKLELVDSRHTGEETPDE